MNALRLACPAFLALLPACREGSDGSRLSNFGLAAQGLEGHGRLWAFAVPESAQGGRDLNQDGDALDEVLHLFDFDTGVRTNLAFAYPGIVTVGDVLVAFGVSEQAQGNTDLNGDGDSIDLILHVHSIATGVTTDTGLAMAALPPAIGIASVAFLVEESSQGATDLNGDGDTLDDVVHVYDARTTLTTNAQRAATTNVAFHDHAFGFTTDEPSAGIDLNGDGDQLDLRVFEMYDLLLGGVEQTPVSILDVPLAVGVDDWFMLVDEAAQGLDLDGDGDESDGVWHVVDPHGGAQTSLGFSGNGLEESLDDEVVLALAASEVDGIDANGDGDESDTQVVLHDPPHDQTFASGLAVSALFPFVLTRTRLAFLVSEPAQGEDSNGDLDQVDDVLHVMDVSNGSVTNLGSTPATMVGVGQVLLLWFSESADGLDRNGDGDAFDFVLTKLHPQFLFEENLALAADRFVLAQAGTAALVAIDEGQQSGDLNGDGDELDQVAYRLEVSFPVDFPERVDTNLGVAIESTSAALRDDGRGLVLVSESGEGRDLNGDGDLLDAVLHRFD